MKKVLVVMMAIMMIAVALVACTAEPAPETSSAAPETSSAAPETSSAAPESPAATTDEGGKTMDIGFSWAHKNDALFYAMDDTLTAAMDAKKAEYGYDTINWIHVIAEDDAQKQASDIDNLITQGVDLIVSYAFDNKAIASSIEAAQAAGIPFIMYDRDADPSVTQPDAFIGLDTTTQAYEAGKAFFAMMKEAGVEPVDIISIEGDYSDTNALNRINGFDRACEEAGVEIAQRVASEWDAAKGLEGFTAAYQAHPDCNTVLIASDFVITAVQSVLETAGKWAPAGDPNHVWICSQDGFPVGVEFARNGYIDASGYYDLEGMADAFATTAFEMVVNGKKPEAENGKIYCAPSVVTNDNIDTATLWAAPYMEDAAA